MKIEFTIPMSKDLIVSEANRSNEHWTVKKKRHDTQEFLINSYFNSRVSDEMEILPCMVKMTRVSPRELDFDNLVSSFKWIKDYIAERLVPGLAKGRADGDKRIKWEYEQIKGLSKQYAVKIEIQSSPKEILE